MIYFTIIITVIVIIVIIINATRSIMRRRLQIDCDESLLPSQSEKHYRYGDESGGHVHPDVGGERRQEREQLGNFVLGLGEQYADTQIHKGHREVDSALPRLRDRQVAYGHISFLKKNI